MQYNLCVIISFFTGTNHTPSNVTVNIQSTAVTVSWWAVKDAESYSVTLTQMMGDKQLGLCSGSHTVSLDTSNLTVYVGQTNDTVLRAYTTYAVTVTAMNHSWSTDGGSETVIFTTDQESVFCHNYA